MLQRECDDRKERECWYGNFLFHGGILAVLIDFAIRLTGCVGGYWPLMILLRFLLRLGGVREKKLPSKNNMLIWRRFVDGGCRGILVRRKNEAPPSDGARNLNNVGVIARCSSHLVTQIGPFLSHFHPLVPILRPVIGAAGLVRINVGERHFDHAHVEAAIV